MFDDGRLELDNNASEPGIKSSVIGRRIGFSPILKKAQQFLVDFIHSSIQLSQMVLKQKNI